MAFTDNQTSGINEKAYQLMKGVLYPQKQRKEIDKLI
jgi:hypothetical protein